MRHLSSFQKFQESPEVQVIYVQMHSSSLFSNRRKAIRWSDTSYSTPMDCD